MTYKGRDQMEIENENICALRKINDNTHRKTSRVEILGNKDKQLPKDDSKIEYDKKGASRKFGATGWNNKKARIGATISSVRHIARLKHANNVAIIGVHGLTLIRVQILYVLAQQAR
jgi:hypothetical protein